MIFKLGLWFRILIGLAILCAAAFAGWRLAFLYGTKAEFEIYKDDTQAVAKIETAERKEIEHVKKQIAERDASGVPECGNMSMADAIGMRSSKDRKEK